MKRKKNYSVWISGRKTPVWNNYAKDKEDAIRKVKAKIEKNRKITKIAKWSWPKSKWVYLKK